MNRELSPKSILRGLAYRDFELCDLMCVNPVEVGRMESMRRAVCLKELRARHEIEDVERRYIYMD